MNQKSGSWVIYSKNGMTTHIDCYHPVIAPRALLEAESPPRLVLTRSVLSAAAWAQCIEGWPETRLSRGALGGWLSPSVPYQCRLTHSSLTECVRAVLLRAEDTWRRGTGFRPWRRCTRFQAHEAMHSLSPRVKVNTERRIQGKCWSTHAPSFWCVEWPDQVGGLCQDGRLSLLQHWIRTANPSVLSENYFHLVFIAIEIGISVDFGILV